MSPSIWACVGRLEKIVRSVTHLLCLFPSSRRLSDRSIAELRGPPFADELPLHPGSRGNARTVCTGCRLLPIIGCCPAADNRRSRTLRRFIEAARIVERRPEVVHRAVGDA